MVTQVAVWGMDGKEAGRECWRNIPEAFIVVQGGDELGWMVIMPRGEKTMAVIGKR